MVKQSKKRKLSDDQAMLALNQHYSLGYPHVKIAKHLGVDRVVILNLCQGHTYREIYMKYMKATRWKHMDAVSINGGR